MFHDTSEGFCIWGWLCVFCLGFFFLPLPPQAFWAGTATEESQSQPFGLILPLLLQFYLPNILMTVWWSGSRPWSTLKLPTAFFCRVTHKTQSLTQFILWVWSKKKVGTNSKGQEEGTASFGDSTSFNVFVELLLTDPIQESNPVQDRASSMWIRCHWSRLLHLFLLFC